MKLLVWGANPVKIFPGEDCISTPTEVELGDEGDEVLWVGWASAIGKKANGMWAISHVARSRGSHKNDGGALILMTRQPLCSLT